MELLGVKLSNDPKDQDCQKVLDDWIRTDLSKLSIPKEVCLVIESYFYCGDEWVAWGKCLDIVRNQNNSKIENIGSNNVDIFGNIISKGTGYGLKIVGPISINNNKICKYYWKIKMGSDNDYTFSIGFVREDDGIMDANGWFVKNRYSVGIYSDKQIWTESVLLCNDGISFKENDLINLCLDYNEKCVYAQRCEYIYNVYDDYQQISDHDDNTDNDHVANYRNYRITDNEIAKHYIIHKAKRVFNGIHSSSKYRLACYLRTQYQNIEIIQFTEQPFNEWEIEEDHDNHKNNKVDMPVIIMYQ